MQNFRQYLNEASLSRIYQHTQDRNIGILSAHRGEFSDEQNRARSAELRNDIRTAGFGHIHLVGHYTENKGEPNERHVQEHSYLVVGKKGHDSGNLRGFLKKHGEKYGQDSVLYKPHSTDQASLIGTGHSDWIKRGEERAAGTFHPSKMSEYHSTLHNRKGFAFESVEVVDSPGFFGRWSYYLANGSHFDEDAANVSNFDENGGA